MLRLILLSAFLTCLIISISSATEIPAGPVSGDWYATGNPYNINGEITVESASTLNIHPGVDVIFQGRYKLIVLGYLNAIGTESDSILFTAADTAVGWHGIRFFDAPDSSRLHYCAILHGRTWGSGGGIHCDNSNPVISHCYMRWNSAESCGGAIYCENSNPAIINCTLIENGEWTLGGGICCKDSSSPIIRSCTISESKYHGIYCGNQSNPTIEDCIITDNRSFGILCGNSSPTIDDCIISDNWEMLGGGINCHAYSSPTISNCTISGNSSGPGGAGIVCEDYSDPIVTYCTITDNGGYEAGGILCGSHSNPTISYCVISQNHGGGGGVCITGSSSAIIENCTITGNSAIATGGGINIQNGSPIIVNTIVEGNTGDGGIWFYGITNASITNSDFYNNENGNFTGNVPDSLEEIITTNFNGDSCDTYFNIFMDPLFEDPMAGDFHLQSNSPCIDAGDPTYPYDPDGTIADIGTFFFDQSGINDPLETPQPIEFHLSQNYPNPFNPTTIIPFELPYAAHVSLKIYNILGQQVATLIDNRLTSGRHTATFNANNLSSGIYFYKLTTTNFHNIKKMILIK